jgi:hypothetical protein
LRQALLVAGDMMRLQWQQMSMAGHMQGLAGLGECVSCLLAYTGSAVLAH